MAPTADLQEPRPVFRVISYRGGLSMIRTWIVSVGFVALGLLATGCGSEGAKKLASEAKDVAKIAKQDVKEVVDEAKLAVIKPIEEALPKIEEKIKGLSGESATKAKEKFEEFKKSLEQFKTAAPGKWESLKEGLVKEFEELKKLVGL
jgi:hypothetical protein